ncbi:ADP-ribose pyrophosphatase [Streptomyces sp. 3211.6]|uniref:NUDIX domain-containing protein n=1 Tax=Streptomyces sp. 3211.6 TaxID=1938845 RepID=UPI000EAFB1DF|nr:NUDIX hydrolase [Streptomyces sp. 3211.6]RKT03929.1 ADP-ribose pyrophosphatase [Streptomyces sp. 3211.6]
MDIDTGSAIKDTAESWETLSTRRPFQGAKTAVDSDEVRMPDGSVARRDYQVHPGSVCVLALDGAGRVLVINQYRHPVRRRLWELPAGLLDVPGENPLHAAQRELYEEAHVKAGDWRVLADFYASPGGSDEAVRIFLARDVAEADGVRYAETDSEEADMRVEWVEREVLVRGVLSGELGNPALVTGVLAVTAALASEAGLDALRPADAPWPARPYEA